MHLFINFLHLWSYSVNIYEIVSIPNPNFLAYPRDQCTIQLILYFFINDICKINLFPVIITSIKILTMVCVDRHVDATSSSLVPLGVSG